MYSHNSNKLNTDILHRFSFPEQNYNSSRPSTCLPSKLVPGTFSLRQNRSFERAEDASMLYCVQLKAVFVPDGGNPGCLPEQANKLVSSKQTRQSRSELLRFRHMLQLDSKTGKFMLSPARRGHLYAGS